MKPLHLTVLIYVFLGLITSCTNSNGSSKEQGTADTTFNSDQLDFESAKTKKQYAEMVINAVKTKRDKLVLNELADAMDVNPLDLREVVGKYSSTFHDKAKFEYVPAVFTDNQDDYDFNWVDKRGRIAYQVSIYPIGEPGQYEIEKIEFRSRIKVIPTMAFPNDDQISDYKEVELASEN